MADLEVISCGKVLRLH